MLQINDPVEALRVRLAGPKRVMVAKNWTQVRPGSRLRLDIPVPTPGRYPLEGNLTARFQGGGTAEMPLSFEVVSLAPLAFRAEATPESVDAGTLRVSGEDGARLERYQLELYGRGKAPLATDQGTIGTDGTIAWSPPDETVLRAVLTVHDTAGRFREVTLYPWRIDVPHEEVRFPTGSAEIPEGEAPKLESSLEALRATLADYGRWAPVKLYIAGHTDTVGSKASNLALSQRRARSIARWFRRHGVRVPIFFAGFGEEVLHRSTPDETASGENRRAEYIVAVDSPPLPPGAPDWIRVP